ncbi:MAG: hypothetical protein FWD13_12750 [Treponema sp.]|nr:hypothetical protein [Treponema sp.]
MATIKKPAAKKPAVKKPAAKATTKKPVAKKPAVKKPAVKKPAVKKPAVKKPAVKAAVKKPAAKKPAVKTVAKATAVKKPAVKAAVKPAAKPAAKIAAPKPATTKAVTKAAEPVKKPAEVADVKFRNLFDAFAQGKLPIDHGFIVSSFFSDTTAYSIYEIVSYAGVKEIFATETGLQFVTGGKKLYVLVEPDTYQIKHQEPVSRSEGERIPKRYNELEIITAKNQYKIMIAKEPNESYGSFTVLKPSNKINFAVVFYHLPDVHNSLAAFFEDSLNRTRKVPQADAKKAAQLIKEIVQKSMGFEGAYK